jgi:hypothetical protein
MASDSRPNAWDGGRALTRYSSVPADSGGPRAPPEVGESHHPAANRLIGEVHPPPLSVLVDAELVVQAEEMLLDRGRLSEDIAAQQRPAQGGEHLPLAAGEIGSSLGSLRCREVVHAFVDPIDESRGSLGTDTSLEAPLPTVTCSASRGTKFGPSAPTPRDRWTSVFRFLEGKPELAGRQGAWRALVPASLSPATGPLRTSRAFHLMKKVPKARPLSASHHRAVAGRVTDLL